MGFLGWIILGLIVGAIVKAVMPGRVGGGWVTSLVLGVVGAIVGGWIGDLLFGGGRMEFWNLGSWLLAIVGGLVVAGIYGAITGRAGQQDHPITAFTTASGTEVPVVTITTAGAHRKVGPRLLRLSGVAGSVSLRLLRAGAGVEADRGGGAEVQALRCPVDGYGHPVVGQREFILGQALGLVAEEPRCGLLQRVDRFRGGVPPDGGPRSRPGAGPGSAGRNRRRRGPRSPVPCTGPPARSTSAPRTTGRWKRDPAVERTALGL